MRGSRLLAAGARAERTPPIGPIRQKNGAAFVQISRDSLCPVGRLRLYRQQTPSGEDRALALKLSYMMAKVGQRPQDSSPINPAEKALYRQLVEALGLSESEVTETEWAAEQELSSGKGVWAALGAAFAGLGAWPSQEMLETPGMQWL